MKDSTHRRRAELRGHPYEIDDIVDSVRPELSLSHSAVAGESLSNAGAENSPELFTRPSDLPQKKPRGRPFEEGNRFGRGRPKNSLNKTTLAMRNLLALHGEEIAEKCLEMARQGDPVALRLAMGQLCPPRRGSPVTLDMPEVRTWADLAVAYASVIRAVSVGELTPAEVHDILPLLEAYGRVLKPAAGE